MVVLVSTCCVTNTSKHSAQNNHRFIKLVDSEGQESKQGTARTAFLCSTWSGAPVGRSKWPGAGISWRLSLTCPGAWAEDPQAGRSGTELLPPVASVGGVSQLGGLGICQTPASSKK